MLSQLDLFFSPWNILKHGCVEKNKHLMRKVIMQWMKAASLVPRSCPCSVPEAKPAKQSSKPTLPAMLRRATRRGKIGVSHGTAEITRFFGGARRKVLRCCWGVAEAWQVNIQTPFIRTQNHNHCMHRFLELSPLAGSVPGTCLFDRCLNSLCLCTTLLKRTGLLRRTLQAAHCNWVQHVGATMAAIAWCCLTVKRRHLTTQSVDPCDVDLPSKLVPYNVQQPFISQLLLDVSPIISISMDRYTYIYIYIYTYITISITHVDPVIECHSCLWIPLCHCD